MNGKLSRLRDIFSKLDKALIAYSGGLDSLFLSKIAFDCLGERVIALTAVSPSFPSYELEGAVRSAKKIGIEHVIIESHELEREEYRANQGDRCYFCKTELYELCLQKANELGISTILNGTNQDDLGDYRPGLQAAHEKKIRSPLLEVGLTKTEIRELARQEGLEAWEKPALACLSSRFPPGTEVTEERLQRIDRIESELVRLGLKHFRVRFHEPIARIEVGSEEMEKFLDPQLRSLISKICHENGFLYASLDLEGYRTGSVNQVLFQIK